VEVAIIQHNAAKVVLILSTHLKIVV
jgi:hypothetical protein